MEKIFENKRRKLSQFFNHNGNIQRVGDLIFSTNNRAFRYGDALFESIRMVGGKIAFPNLHADRLRKSMQTLQLDGYSKITTQFLEDTIYDLCRRNKIFSDARVRFTVYRNAGGFYTPEENQFSFLVEMDKLETKGYSLEPKGISICIYKDMFKHYNALSSFKTANALLYVLASNYKKQMGVNEALILNDKGNISEAGNANIFLVKNDELFTPSLEEACICGVMRTAIIQLAEKNGIKVNEGIIAEEYLNTADEVFLSNASTGIRWVSSFGKKRYFNKVARRLVDLLNKSL